MKWTCLFNEPLLPNGKPHEWNSSESGHPFAFTDEDGRIYLFYQGNNDRGKTRLLSHVKIAWDNDRPCIAQSPRGYATVNVRVTGLPGCAGSCR